MNIIKILNYTPQTPKGGYTDRILEVDLSTQEMKVTTIPSEFKHKYIGGRGYALKFIWDKTNENTRYDSPENLLIMAGGPLCNEPKFPGSGKFIVGTISPLTDTFIDSNIGGHFAPLLKICGFDAMVFSGISQKPVIIVVNENLKTISLAEAPSYGDKTDNGGLAYGEALLNDISGSDVGENWACVTTGIGSTHSRYGIVNSLFFDKRRGRLRSKQAGRGGTGTVMRFKGLMGVVVTSEKSRLKANNAADPEGVHKAGGALKKVISNEDPTQLNLRDWGTTALVEYMNKFHCLPIKNYQFGQDDEAPKVYAEIFLDRYFARKIPDGCYLGCNLACAKGAEDVTLKRGPNAGAVVGIDGPEYETMGAVTAMGIFDPQFIMEFNWYCDEYGLDTISMGVTAAFLMECFQRKYLTIDQAGYDLTWGNIESADRLLHETGSGTGLGKICGQGVARAKAWVAENHKARTGADLDQTLAELTKFAMELKGLEFSMYITKESLAQQGGYGFALKGPQHDEAWLIFIDQVHGEIPTTEMKAKALKWFPLVRTWFNAVGLCKLPWIDVRHPDAADTENPAQNTPSLEYYRQYFNATTGSNKSMQDLFDDSERLQLLQKLINVRQGKGSRIFDQIPDRAMGPAFINEYEGRSEYYGEWLKEKLGSNDGYPATDEERRLMLMEKRREAYSNLCDEVYRSKGYSENAIPKVETVKRFDLFDSKAESLLEKQGE